MQHHIQRLIPRHVLETQSQITIHTIRSNNIEICEICNYLQQRTNFHILEIQRQFFTPITWTLRQFVRVNTQGMQLHDQLVVTLISRMLPFTARCNGQANTIACLRSSNPLNRRAKISHIKSFLQSSGQRRFQQINHQILPLRLDIHADLTIGQLHHDTTAVVFTATEIDTTQWQHIGTAVFREYALFCIGSGRQWRRSQSNQQGFPAHICTVGRGLLQIDDHARALATLYHLGRTQITTIEVLYLTRDFTGYSRQIQGNARRALHHEPRR